MAAFGKLFKGRQFIPVKPVMTVGAFDMNGGLGRTAYIGREIEFAGHFDLRALALWNGFCAGRILAGVSWEKIDLVTTESLHRPAPCYKRSELVIHFR
jgi:hypothetical protein